MTGPGASSAKRSPHLVSEFTFVVLWMAAAVAMSIHLVGFLAFGWSADGVGWWVALVMLLAMSAFQGVDYVYGRWYA